jgi:acyl carrier protein
MTDPTETIRAVVARIARIPAPAAHDDMYTAGLASTDALELLIELEDTFGIAIPDDQFIAARTPAQLAQVVAVLGGGEATS